MKLFATLAALVLVAAYLDLADAHCGKCEVDLQEDPNSQEKQPTLKEERQTSSLHESYTGSPDFERMKRLVGSWVEEPTNNKDGYGTAEAVQSMTLDYRLTSGGAVLKETVNRDTPDEMVTMYYDQDGQLSLTHFCTMKNHPRMILSESTADQLRFELAPDISFGDSANYISKIQFRFVDENHIFAGGTAVINGQPEPAFEIRFHRVE